MDRYAVGTCLCFLAGRFLIEMLSAAGDEWEADRQRIGWCRINGDNSRLIIAAS